MSNFSTFFLKTSNDCIISKSLFSLKFVKAASKPHLFSLHCKTWQQVFRYNPNSQIYAAASDIFLVCGILDIANTPLSSSVIQAISEHRYILGPETSG